MDAALNRTKTILPRRRPEILSRGRLLDIMSSLLDNRLTILAAPAGYGKTSLLVDMAHLSELPVCWLSLDSLDRDYKRFLTYLIASINQKFPKFGSRSMAILQGMNQFEDGLEQLILTMVNEAYDTIQEHYAIVLDDYHYIDDQPEINTFLGRLIQDMDENCHLVIASRTLLSLPGLPLMVARSQVGGLGFDELAFQPEEIRALIQQNYKETITESVARDLATETEGWITGLLLSTQTSWQGMNDRLRVARVSAVGLYDYLAQQVLDQQDLELREFLLRSSIMDEFDADLCQRLFGSPPNPFNSWPLLFEFILKNNLFVLPVGEKGNWLRYHHLFRDFLHNRLSEEDPEQEKLLTERLADIYAQSNDWEQAFLLYKKLGLPEKLVELVETAGTHLVKTGRINTLVTWIDSLPFGSSAARPKLLSLRGSAAAMLGEAERAVALLTNAEVLFQAGGNPYDRATNLMRRSHAYRFLSNYPQAILDANTALEIASAPEHPMVDVQAECWRSLGISNQKLGDLEKAAENLKQAVFLYDASDNPENVALAQIDLGSIYRSLGEYTQARYAYENALKIFENSGNITRAAVVNNNLGVLNLQIGEFERAGKYLENALELAQQSGYLRIQALAYLNIGDLYRFLDALDAALAAFQHAQEVIERINDPSFMFFLFTSQASCYCDTSQVELALEKLEQSKKLSHQISTPADLGYFHFVSGRLALIQNNNSEAVMEFARAEEYFITSRQTIDQILCKLYLAYTWRQAGRRDEERDYLRLASSQIKTLPDLNSLVHQIRTLQPYLADVQSDLPYSAEIQKAVMRIVDFTTRMPIYRRIIRRQVSVVPFAPPRLTIQTLGKNRIYLDGKLVTHPQWQTQNARDLLFLLLAHPEGMTKEEISNVFWANASPNQVKTQFKNTIYRMRRALEQEVVLYHNELYSFNHDLDYEYDVDIFNQKVDQASGSSIDDEKILAYKQALHIYKGIYLPEITSEWTVSMRDLLQEKHQGAAIELIRALTRTGEYSTALNICQEILIKDPCLEEVHRLAMQIHAYVGNKANIIRQFERCTHALKRELNVLPSPQTISLYENLIH